MWIVSDICKVIAVLVIARIVALDIVNPALQLVFQSGVAVFHFHKVAVLGRIGRSKHAV